jgi:hypothetical protein
VDAVARKAFNPLTSGYPYPESWLADPEAPRIVSSMSTKVTSAAALMIGVWWVRPARNRGRDRVQLPDIADPERPQEGSLVEGAARVPR